MQSAKNDFVASSASNAYDRSMAVSHAPSATITIGNLDGRVKKRLRGRAAMNGRSMEAEVRSIFSDTLGTEAVESVNLAEAIRRRVAPLRGIELEDHPAISLCEPLGWCSKITVASFF